MSDYQIRLKPVYSQTVPTPEGLVFPAGWNLAWHQLATLEALRDRLSWVYGGNVAIAEFSPSLNFNIW